MLDKEDHGTSYSSKGRLEVDLASSRFDAFVEYGGPSLSILAPAARHHRSGMSRLEISFNYCTSLSHTFLETA